MLKKISSAPCSWCLLLDQGIKSAFERLDEEKNELETFFAT